MNFYYERVSKAELIVSGSPTLMTLVPFLILDMRPASTGLGLNSMKRSCPSLSKFSIDWDQRTEPVTWRSRELLISTSPDFCIASTLETTGKFGFYPKWVTDGTVIENEFYLRNVRLIELSEGPSDAQFPEYNCTNMMYCTTVCYDNPILENGNVVETGRTKEEIQQVENYYKSQNSFRDSTSKDPEYYKSLYEKQLK